MRAVIAAQLSVWHFRAANWHFQRGEAWIWRYYAATDPRGSGLFWIVPTVKMLAATLMALLIAAPWVWIVWRSTW